MSNFYEGGSRAEVHEPFMASAFGINESITDLDCIKRETEQLDAVEGSMELPHILKRLIAVRRGELASEAAKYTRWIAGGFEEWQEWEMHYGKYEDLVATSHTG